MAKRRGEEEGDVADTDDGAKTMPGGITSGPVSSRSRRVSPTGV